MCDISSFSTYTRSQDGAGITITFLAKHNLFVDQHISEQFLFSISSCFPVTQDQPASLYLTFLHISPPHTTQHMSSRPPQCPPAVHSGCVSQHDHRGRHVTASSSSHFFNIFPLRAAWVGIIFHSRKRNETLHLYEALFSSLSLCLPPYPFIISSLLSLLLFPIPPFFWHRGLSCRKALKELPVSVAKSVVKVLSLSLPSLLTLLFSPLDSEKRSMFIVMGD